ncbi:hypothetical protein OCOJLMKI_0065 [Methylobacterium iners]|uniref:HNH endonuclease n=1 Tax=Methylobacterium iners TaxID=418707 RepID=A0ABQ4RSD8_9HYPH|nr:hypothetical protein OCOJLMKI_0065 [Methylobacterium iners]
MFGPGGIPGAVTHGSNRRGRRAPEYTCWSGMHSRCTNQKLEAYKYYGGRGISVCAAWKDFSQFLADMGPRPSPAHSIERLDNDGNYEPGNCVWATREVQSKNKRPRAVKTTCAAGHELSGENLYSRPDGKRGCRACRRRNMRDFYARQSQEVASERR